MRPVEAYNLEKIKYEFVTHPIYIILVRAAQLQNVSAFDFDGPLMQPNSPSLHAEGKSVNPLPQVGMM